jgi:hypothetical protein
MKRKSILFHLFAVMLCGFTTTATGDIYNQPQNDCCKSSLLNGKVTVEADWLYWKVQQDGILTGNILTENNEEISTNASRGVWPNFKYDNGFRLNIGCQLPCDYWDVHVIYTYMPAHAKTTPFFSDSNSVRFITNDFTNQGNFNTYNSAWDFTGNNIDFDFGRTLNFGECLTIRPHAGFRATWFDQKFRDIGTTFINPTTTFFLTDSVKETFQGYGVEAGLWADLKLGYGISLIGHIGGAILYSRYEVNTKSSNFLIEENVGETIFGITFLKDKIFVGTPMVDYFLGLQYADTFCDVLIKARVGWEQHVIFDTNRYLLRGNLSTQGLTLGLDVGF